MIKRFLALLLSGTLALPACATTGATGTAAGASPELNAAQRAVIAEYVQKLPLGSIVRVDRVRGRTVRGTLLKATDRAVFVQPRVRIPEPAVEIPIDDVVSVTLEAANGSSVAKAVGVGAAAGAGAALVVILVLIAAFSD